MRKLPNSFIMSKAVIQARSQGTALVALESAVITHGLPHPQNLHLAQDMEQTVQAQSAVAATIALLNGKVHIGLEVEELQGLASAKDARKISGRDLAGAISSLAKGGTTVAGTLVAAEKAGLRVFATGGIGGVHRYPPNDISADLPQLAASPLVVVCSGAKSILDLPATLEYLETVSVPVIGYQTSEFPAFFARSSGLPVSERVDTPEQAAAIAQAHWELGSRSALLVVVPPPAEAAMPEDKIAAIIEQATQEADESQIRGQQVTPYLLRRINELSNGESLQANLALLKNNARVAAQIANHIHLDSPLKYA